MSPENSKKLVEIYPEIFSHSDNNSCMRLFGFECGDGWFDILKDLIEEIKIISKKWNFSDDAWTGPLKVNQVKEKYGILRFYTNWETEELAQAIGKAENNSKSTCEICGKDGKSLSRDAWWMVRCERCAANSSETFL